MKVTEGKQGENMDQTNETKILVVDDEARIRRLLRMYLERENYAIDEAENGDEAIAKGLEANYDLILLDLMMPGTDGIEVCRQIREKSDTHYYADRKRRRSKPGAGL